MNLFKQKIIVVMKAAEILIMAFGVFAILQTTSSFVQQNSCLRGEILVENICEPIEAGFVTETDGAVVYRRCKKSIFSGTAFCDDRKYLFYYLFYPSKYSLWAIRILFLLVSLEKK